MKHLFVRSLLCPLLVASACTGGKADDEGGGTGTDTDNATETGTTTTPEPLQCGYGGEILDEGQQADSPDGCVTYVCESGAMVIVEDRRATVAGDLDLATQEAVDGQSCLGVVEGNLSISGTAADLTPLLSLYRVGGALEIVASEATTLSGLEGITEVGGSITIADNASLTMLMFQSYLSAFGDVTIQNNDALTSLAGAEFLGQCGSCIGIGGRPQELVDHVEGEAAETTGSSEPGGDGGLDQPQGGTFYGAILIADNDALTDVLAISNLYYAWSDVRFRNNAALTSLLGLQLVEVQGNLEISGHVAMSTVDAEAFAAGISVLGTTTICGNLDGPPCA
jgi:hypothetical protein